MTTLLLAAAAAVGCSARAKVEGQGAAQRTQAALVAGRLHDAKAAPQLALLLAEGNETAAWALGRIDGSRGGEAPLVRCLTDACPAAAAAARALGGPGRGPEALAALTAALAGEAKIAAEAAVALMVIARMAGQPAVNDGPEQMAQLARPALLLALARPEASVREGAAMALGRIAERKDQALPAALGAALRDPAAEVRLQAPRAAAKNGASAAQLGPLLRDPDWRVRVEAARALAGTNGAAGVIAAALPAAVVDAAKSAQQAHALAALLEAAGRARVPVPEPDLSAPTPAATAAIRCAAAEAHDRAAGKLERLPSCGRGFEAEWRTRLRAAVVAAELAWPQAQFAFGDPDGRVRAQAAGAASPALAPQLVRLMETDPDPYVVANAAGSLAKDAKLARESLPAALRALARFQAAKDQPAGPPQVDALTALVQLVAAGRKGQPPPPDDPLRALLPSGSVALHRALAEALPGLAELPPSLPIPGDASGPRAQRLVLSTTAGELTIALRSAENEAPLGSAAVAGLARRRFYDGLSWHRVVADFVIQGGDPRGDGDGSPGYTLPDEHTPLRFRRGTMGIATNGPGTETGSSQIFLCHSAQPHLDGRYTIVGELVEGFEVMDAIHVGDVILKATAY